MGRTPVCETISRRTLHDFPLPIRFISKNAIEVVPMKRILLFLSLLLCLAFPALADDVCTVDASSAVDVSCPESYLCVTCPISGEEQVTVSVADASGRLHYQRNYGLCSGSFRSEDMYLRLEGSETRYQVTLQAGEKIYSFSVMRVMGRLSGNEACSVGYPLSRLNGSSSCKTVTLLDVNALSGSSMTVPLYASGAYTLGTVTFSVSGDHVTVSAQLSGGVDGSIDKSVVYVATDAIAAQNLGTRRFDGHKGKLNEAISLDGTPYAAVLVQLTVSFEPSGVPGSPETTLNDQRQLWQLMQENTASESVG